ncbi:hypothetical protein M493_17050 [Geobacillus genomosp. 3]|uniref:Uncharacterized protein n=1 Tax=Geobacillus genomosp. 3 TaxID=1921421 RepID=S5Z3I9_GEOG3|nr:hypothetical protein M493_17050 [Geobacillus genomosp. 3]
MAEAIGDENEMEKRTFVLFGNGQTGGAVWLRFPFPFRGNQTCRKGRG